MPFERLDDLEQAGAALALTGGLIAVVPEAQLLLYSPPGWKAALVLMLLAVAVVGAVALAIASQRILGGVLALVGGALLVLGGSKDPAGTSGLAGREGPIEP